MKYILTLLLSLLSLWGYSQNVIVDAGTHQTLIYPTNQTTLSGSASLSGGTIKAYSWVKISGSKYGYILSQNKATATIRTLHVGTYVFRLTATGVTGSHHIKTGSDTVSVTVDSSGGCVYRTPTSYTFTASGGDIYRPNVSMVLPGDTCYIAAGSYGVIEFYHLHGNACQPVIIKPKGNVYMTTRFKVIQDSFVVVDGFTAGNIPQHNCLFHITGVEGCIESNHILLQYFDVTNPAGVGLFFKENIDTTNPYSYYPLGNQNKISILHQWVHNTGGEGMYLNFCCPDGDPPVMGYLPAQGDSFEVAYNYVENTDWDGIQLATSNTGNSIHDNYVYNFGRVNMGSQQAGIIAGGLVSGDVYNNTVIKGTGNGIELFGYGTINCYNNIVDSTGNDGSPNGQNSIFTNQYNLTSFPSANHQQINIYNNTIVTTQKIAAIRVQNDGGNASGATATGNHICGSSIVGAPIILDPAGSSQSGNTISCP